MWLPFDPANPLLGLCLPQTFAKEHRDQSSLAGEWPTEKCIECVPLGMGGGRGTAGFYKTNT